jgi:hypothetical protein
MPPSYLNHRLEKAALMSCVRRLALSVVVAISSVVAVGAAVLWIRQLRTTDLWGWQPESDVNRPEVLVSDFFLWSDGGNFVAYICRHPSDGGGPGPYHLTHIPNDPTPFGSLDDISHTSYIPSFLEARGIILSKGTYSSAVPVPVTEKPPQIPVNQDGGNSTKKSLRSSKTFSELLDDLDTMNHVATLPGTHYYLQLPAWLVVVTASILPVRWAVCYLRSRRKSRRGFPMV